MNLKKRMLLTIERQMILADKKDAARMSELLRRKNFVRDFDNIESSIETEYKNLIIKSN